MKRFHVSRSVGIVLLIFLVVAVYFFSNSYGGFVSHPSKIKNIQSTAELKDVRGLVYFGRETCNECKKFKDLLEKEHANYDTPIYYFDTDKFRENKDFDKVMKQYDVIGVPRLVQADKGKSVASMVFSIKLSDEETQALLDQFIERDIQTQQVGFSNILLFLYLLVLLYLVAIRKDILLSLITLFIFNIVIPALLLLKAGTYVDALSLVGDMRTSILMGLNVLIFIIVFVGLIMRKGGEDKNAEKN